MRTMSGSDPAVDAARRLHQSGEAGRVALTREALAAVADSLVRTIDPAGLAVAGGDRSYRQLLVTAGFDAWLIAWGPSSLLELHDHGGSIGAVRVVAGELVETYSDLSDRHPLRWRTVGSGAGFSIPSSRVHEMWNAGPEDAWSVHVYSPPLRAMTFFDHDGEWFGRPLRTDYGDAATLEGSDVPVRSPAGAVRSQAR